jgi:hypothetical protein
MSQENNETSPETMWSLSDNRQTVRLAVPPVRVRGLLEPIRVVMDFNAAEIDELLKRLIVLRARMPEEERQAVVAPASDQDSADRPSPSPSGTG